MGLFGIVWSTFKKSEASVVVQNLLSLEAENGLFAGDEAVVSRKLVQAAWETMPSVFDGKLGVRPHKLAVAGTAFAVAIKDQLPAGRFEPVYLLCLGRILEAVERRKAELQLSGVDAELLAEASDVFRKAENQLAASAIGQEIDEMLLRCQTDWDAWLNAYKAEAARFNSDLKLDENGYSIIDLMEDEPLRRAFRDKVDPVRLGRSFSQTFDISRMKH